MIIYKYFIFNIQIHTLLFVFDTKIITLIFGQSYFERKNHKKN